MFAPLPRLVCVGLRFGSQPVPAAAGLPRGLPEALQRLQRGRALVLAARQARATELEGLLPAGRRMRCVKRLARREGSPTGPDRGRRARRHTG